MNARLRAIMVGMGAVLIGVTAGVLASSFTAFVVVTLLAAWVLDGIVIIRDNTARAFYLFGLYQHSEKRRGLHLALWPMRPGQDIDLCDHATEFEQRRLFTVNQVSFSCRYIFWFSFDPTTIRDKRTAAQWIGRGETYRLEMVRQVIRECAAEVIRSQPQARLLSGPVQAQVQSWIAQRAAQKLAHLGIQLPCERFMLEVEAPQRMESAYIENSVAQTVGETRGLRAQATAHSTASLTDAQLLAALDWDTVEQLAKQSGDPTTALVLRDLMRRNAASKPGTP